jgi:hypothetical protein
MAVYVTVVIFFKFMLPPQSKEGIYVGGVWGPYKASDPYRIPCLFDLTNI